MVKKEEEKEDNSGVGTRMGSTLLFRLSETGRVATLVSPVSGSVWSCHGKSTRIKK